MSRRCHHGSPRHVRNGRVTHRPGATDVAPALGSTDQPEPAEIEGVELDVEELVGSPTASTVDPDRFATDAAAPEMEPGPSAVLVAAPPDPSEPQPPRRPMARSAAPFRPPVRPRPRPVTAPSAASPDDEAVEPGVGTPGQVQGGVPGLERFATAPQLRRFIKSRAYVPMHELRRRFAIDGGEDDVTAVDLDRSRIYVGLPEREGRLLGELLRGGDIGYELSLDPISPIVVGVYPMRPVTRS
ncbi:MAG TPA: hypothetical protein VKR30_00245 [Candidatus Limnocylindrales bacterium]|nr:hypothetical protein [Candidatus Limnocylindrales bacterium]